MRGSVNKRGTGYSVVVELERDPQTGKRRQKWHSGYRTKREAECGLARAGRRRQQGYVCAEVAAELWRVRRRVADCDRTDRQASHPLQLRSQPAAACPAVHRYGAACIGRRRDLERPVCPAVGRGRKDYAGVVSRRAPSATCTPSRTAR